MESRMVQALPSKGQKHVLVHWVVLKGAYPASLNAQNPVLKPAYHKHRTATNQCFKVKRDTLAHTVETLGSRKKAIEFMERR